MAESTLTLTFNNLADNVARQLGFKPDRDDRSTAENTRVDELVHTGCRLFLAPDWSAAQVPPHSWSFARLSTTVATEDGTGATTLPDDFGFMLDNQFYFSDSDDSPFHTVKIRDEGVIRAKLQQDDDYEEQPEFAAIIPVTPFAGATGQRWQALWYPIPDDTYPLIYPYFALPGQGSSTNYLQGGMLHIETIKACCRAAAEHEMTREMGLEHQAMLSRIRASYEVDRQMSPTNWGYFRQHRDSGATPHGIVHGNATVTYTAD